MIITQLGNARYQVGEGPLWDPARAELLLVDIVGQTLAIYDERGSLRKTYALPQPLVGAVRTVDEQLLVVLADGFYVLDEQDGRCEPLGDFRVPEGATFNDAKVDREGRVVAVAADRGMKAPVGSIYSLAADGLVTPIEHGFAIGNGPCWSPDGRRFYVAESTTRRIYAYDYNVQGKLGLKRELVDATQLGMPDGATVDSEGYLWVAMCGAGKIARYAPDGALDRTIDMPTAWVASVMFGGAELDRLYVTSLDPVVVGLTGDELCGGVFVVDGLGVKGLPERRAALRKAPAPLR